MPEETAEPQRAAERAAASDPALAAAADAYWRLWRRNWRPPFGVDAPAAAPPSAP